MEGLESLGACGIEGHGLPAWDGELRSHGLGLGPWALREPRRSAWRGAERGPTEAERAARREAAAPRLLLCAPRLQGADPTGPSEGSVRGGRPAGSVQTLPRGIRSCPVKSGSRALRWSLEVGGRPDLRVLAPSVAGAQVGQGGGDSGSAPWAGRAAL